MSSSGTLAERTGKKNRVVPIKDEENFLNYRPSDFQTEKGLGLGNNFDQQANGMVLDLTADDSSKMNKSSSQLKWDRKKKKYVRTGSGTGEKKIRTESGALIPASYQSNLYKDWLNKNHADIDDDQSDGEEQGGFQKFTASGTTDRNKRWQTTEDSSAPPGGKRRKLSKKGREIKQPEQILKVRRKKAKHHAFQQKQNMKRQKRKTIQSSKAKRSF